MDREEYHLVEEMTKEFLNQVEDTVNLHEGQILGAVVQTLFRYHVGRTHNPDITFDIIADLVSQVSARRNILWNEVDNIRLN